MSLYFNTKVPGNEFKKIFYNWSISTTSKAYLHRKSLICSPWKSEMYKISYTLLQKKDDNYTIGLFQFLQRQICVGIWYVLPEKRIVYDTNTAKEERLDLKGSLGRPKKKMTQRVESKMIKTVYDSSQSSTKD